MEIKVKCHSGYIYAEEPRSFIWQEKEFIIKSVEKMWLEPGKGCSKLLLSMVNYLNCVTMRQIANRSLLN